MSPVACTYKLPASRAILPPARTTVKALLAAHHSSIHSRNAPILTCLPVSDAGQLRVQLVPACGVEGVRVEV